MCSEGRKWWSSCQRIKGILLRDVAKKLSKLKVQKEPAKVKEVDPLSLWGIFGGREKEVVFVLIRGSSNCQEMCAREGTKEGDASRHEWSNTIALNNTKGGRRLEFIVQKRVCKSLLWTRAVAAQKKTSSLLTSTRCGGLNRNLQGIVEVNSQLRTQDVESKWYRESKGVGSRRVNIPNSATNWSRRTKPRSNLILQVRSQGQTRSN
ncbi:hypothetical protein LOK49_LG12G02159 [Camellia lanceoleosa]|uniref:Uncharacterized protein n=1 Tax=Camellia lanceoleosa TaxID=1840588 RepID=A0ACC0FRQ7_9ERIC|nr:hypothetical protein LOK49_LG12G02159 [Camellia lanceoleosa]